MKMLGVASGGGKPSLVPKAFLKLPPVHASKPDCIRMPSGKMGKAWILIPVLLLKSLKTISGQLLNLTEA